MGNKLLRLQTAPALLLSVTTLLWLPAPAHAQSTASQDRDSRALPSDDITRRDLARFDQFLEGHREIAAELRRTPSLIDDPEYLQNHPELNAYLQEHPGVKQEISQRPDDFMRLEDRYDHDRSARDRDASGPDRDAGGGDRGAYRRDLADFDRFLDEHREIAEQVRKDPSLLDNREFLQSHPALQSFLQNNPGVRDQLKRDPTAFMKEEDLYDRDPNARDRDTDGRDRDADGRDHDANRRELADFDRFLDKHREIAEQVRKDPSLLDKREFVQNHPALQSFLQDNPGVRDQLKQDPNGFMRQEDRFDRSQNGGDRYATYRMADFGGFLGEHSDIQRDLSRNPSVVKDHAYVENHAELNAYLSAHPDVRDELMANPQSFVKGAQHFSNGSAGTASGAGVNGSGSGLGTTAPSTGNSTNPEPQPNPKPKQ
jgi:phage-related protein